MWEYILTFLVLLIGILYLIGRRKHNYWNSIEVYSPEDECLPFLGHIKSFYVKPFRWKYIDEIYKKNKDKRFWGFYEMWSPTIIISDLELIKSIFVKDASNFIDRRVVDLPNSDKVYKEFLTILRGEDWKLLRNITTPAFTSGKIKGMFSLVNEKVDYFLKNCNKSMEEDGFIEIQDKLDYFTLDVIGTCAFGIEIDSMKNKTSPFVEALRSALNPPKSTMVKGLIFTVCPSLFKALGLSLESSGIKFLEKAIEESIKSRRIAGTRRGDFLDQMLDALKEYEESGDIKKNSYPMKLTTVISSCMLFLVAGYSTTSNALAFAAYLLAKNTEVQDTLREELKSILEEEKELNYQNVMEAKYLDSCFSETLRMYAPVHLHTRLCTESFKIPDSDVEIPKGMMVYIPAYSIHYDDDYFEDPESFKPERFLPENKSNIIPYSYTPFGHGPRNCIGMRFALMEAKLALAKLVLNFKLSLKPGFEMKVSGRLTSTAPDSDLGIQLVLNTIHAVKN